MRKTDELRETNELKGKNSSVRTPHWLTCTWLRTPCGKKNCPVCSVLAREQKKLLAQGVEDIDLLDALDDVRYGIAEAFLDVLHFSSIKKGIRSPRMGRSPKRFPLYQELDSWHENLHEVFDEADFQSAFWLESVDAADLDWYAHILLDYLRRFLEYGIPGESISPAKKYVRSVLRDAAKTVEEKISRLALCDCAQKGSLMLLSGRFNEFKRRLFLL
jgi:hypothetical protein